MKKIKILGKAIPVFVLVLLGIGMVSGALVGYLSNQVKTEITVDSPIEQWNSLTGTGSWIKDDLSFNILGPEPVTFYVKTENKASVSVEGEGKNIVINTGGVTCGDFESVVVSTNTDGAGYGTEYDLIALGGFCSEPETWKVVFSYGPTPIVWSAGQTDINRIVVTFKSDAKGTYTFTSEVVPV